MEISESEFNELLTENTNEYFKKRLNIKNLNIWFDDFDQLCKCFGYLSTPIKIGKNKVNLFIEYNKKIIEDFNDRQKNREFG